MLRNKIGKPSQTPLNTQGGKITDNKPATTQISSSTGSKAPLGIGSGIGIGGIKSPGLIGVKPQTKLPVNNLTATQSQGPIPTMSKKETSQNFQLTQTKTQHKPQAIRHQQIKTEQQRLAQLVTKKAAQMKKEYQMINKISSQVGSQKKSYFKEYQAKFSHVLKATRKISKKDKENVSKLDKMPVQAETKSQHMRSDVLWQLNGWDIQNNLKQYLMANFKPDKYM